MDIPQEMQSYVDKRLSKLEQRITALEGSKVPVIEIKPIPAIVEAPKPIPAPWSQKEVPPVQNKWRFYESSDKLMINRNNETRMRSNLSAKEIAEAAEDIPGFAPEVETEVLSPNETDNTPIPD